MPPHDRRRRNEPQSRPPLPSGLRYEEVLLPVPQGGLSSSRRPHSPPRFRAPAALQWLAGRQPQTSIPRPISSPPSRPSDEPLTSATWVLSFDRTSTMHKCADIHLFRPPYTVGEINSGTVVLPILPGPARRFGFDVSVMTLTPTRYAPVSRYSELNWPLLARQGFTKTDLHHDHEHDSTQGTPLCMGRTCKKVSSVIRHPNIPGVDLLWCGYDEDKSPHVFVHMTAFDMVDPQLWKVGVKTGVVGRAADMDGRLAWIEPGNDSPFERIVQGGLRR
ncbi:hypothetical protein EDD37DRAFT_650835 [Exophiala viscosa]|uniref:uncharacterized protein n=1 Tax=Exophiala viscosa TaxID=2486360 RepID=UPI00218FC7B6|nr:hypothetical protein EDD37DRAFT_650835 [Exophiala viscosa]